ncbi:MAG: hypothetical protein ACE5HY_04275 [Candidatus Hydrothermarchaeales archaeon]
MKRAFVFCLLVLMSTACLQATKSTEIEPPAKSSSALKATMIEEDPAKFVLQEEDLPPGFNFDIGWYQDLEARASLWNDPEERRRQLLEWGYINSYINRFMRDFDSPIVFIEPYIILSKVSRYETPEGAKKAYDYQIHRWTYEEGYKRISSLDIGDEGELLKYTFKVEDSDFSYYVVWFRYQNTVDSVLVGGFVGSPNRDETVSLAKRIEGRLENYEK